MRSISIGVTSVQKYVNSMQVYAQTAETRPFISCSLGQAWEQLMLH